MNTVLITGCSSGIGRATAMHFADRGWNVVATMRNPNRRESDLRGRKNIELMHLDVMDCDSIRDAVRFAEGKHGEIHALVNNAGYPTRGLFEAATADQVRRQFDTNVIGLMDVTREVLPVMRRQGRGVVVNVTSIGGRTSSPLYSLYQSTKFAVEGFSESLFYELRSQNIKVKIVEPGVIKTNFYSSSMDHLDMANLGSYRRFVDGVTVGEKRLAASGSPPEVVADCIYRAVTDSGWRLRYHAGKYSGLILTLRKILPDRAMMRLACNPKIGRERA